MADQDRFAKIFKAKKGEQEESSASSSDAIDMHKDENKYLGNFLNKIGAKNKKAKERDQINNLEDEGKYNFDHLFVPANNPKKD